MNEFADYDALGLAHLVRTKQVKPSELLDAALGRAEGAQEQINCFSALFPELAHEQLEQPLGDGPFAGVPFATKDLAVDIKGAPITQGSVAWKGHVASEDSTLAARYRKAGLVFFGATTTPEFGLTLTTESTLHGQTRNPWDTTRTSGGSSGGAAAAVASGVLPLAQASDGGGSIRIPAACCGVFGLKPSRGQLPAHDGPNGPPVDISVQHAVTISVRDSANLFRDTQTNDRTYPPLSADLQPLQRRLKIGFSTDAFAGTQVAPETKAALEDVANLCAGLGHEIVPYTPSFSGQEFLDKFLLYWAAGAADFAQQASAFSGKPVGPDIVEPWTLGLTNMFMARKDEMDATVAWLKGFESQYDSGFTDQGIDVLLTPVTGSPAVKLGEQAPTVAYDTLYNRVVTFASFTAPMNVSGAASMSVPLSWSPSGLPIGSMFSGKRGDDQLLFELALELEAARPWADRLPGVVAS